MSLEPDAPNRAAAASAVKGPAIGLIVAGSLGAIGCLFSFTQSAEGVRGMYEGLGMPKDQVDQMMNLAGPMQTVINVGLLLLNAFVIFGALKMMKLSSWGLAMATCIVAMLDCANCCCVLTIPFAIWGLIVLNKAEVKAAFQ